MLIRAILRTRVTQNSAVTTTVTRSGLEIQESQSIREITAKVQVLPTAVLHQVKVDTPIRTSITPTRKIHNIKSPEAHRQTTHIHPLAARQSFHTRSKDISSSNLSNHLPPPTANTSLPRSRRAPMASASLKN